jgi:hypothetical protein
MFRRFFYDLCGKLLLRVSGPIYHISKLPYGTTPRCCRAFATLLPHCNMDDELLTDPR